MAVRTTYRNDHDATTKYQTQDFFVQINKRKKIGKQIKFFIILTKY